MPLFSSKDKHHHTAELVGHSTVNPAHTATGVGGTNYDTEPGVVNSGMNAPYGGATNTGIHHGGHTGPGMHTGAGNMAGVGAGYNNEPGYNSTAGMHHQHQPGVLGAGTGTGMSSHHGGPMSGATDIPPTGAVSDHHQNRHGSGTSISGKAERVIGTLVGSQSLKAKGAEKEAEAKAFQMQSAELSEAERLEAEAKMRRERAVAHGAHPENINLGAGVGTNHLRSM